MFTGLIEAICTVKSVSGGAGADTARLTVDLGELADGGKTGDSIAINGVCLTIAELTGTLATFELSAETLKKSTLGKLRPLSRVNIERALKSGDRFGGHFVQGHIDGTATIKTINKQAQFADIWFQAGTELLEQVVVKGSVAVDGVSLTIASLDQGSFSTALIPQTLSKTTLGTAKIGDSVNIETDIIVKTIKKQLENILPKEQRLTEEKLKQLGF